MRTEREMFNLILTTAESDPRIRAVYMNGSRCNPNADKDIFQDYDIVYVVYETQTFIDDKSWIDRFGQRLYMQYPEESVYFPSDTSACYGWLMQFADGNRLDLHVQTLDYTLENIQKDRLCKILLDKEGILPKMPPATDADFYVIRPEEPHFLACCNEFWWCLNNVAKGLWRGEIPYVQDMLNIHIRPELVRLLSWQIGLEHDFAVSIGKSGKYMKRYLPQSQWQMFLDTYADSQIENLWNAVDTMCQLFDETARRVARDFGFRYDTEEALNSWGYLKHVRYLPKEAKKIY